MNINDFIKQNKELKIEEYKVLTGSFIYFICEPTGEIIYIGATVYPQSRFKTHAERIEFCDKPIYLFSCELEECRELEKRLIIKIKPEYNIQYIPGLKRKNGPHIGAKINKESATKVRKQIKKKMVEKEITQDMLAKQLGVSRQRASQLINGKFGFHFLTIEKLEKALGCRLQT